MSESSDRIDDANDTVFVLLTDQPYLHKALNTIRELRLNGGWDGTVVLLTIQCSLSQDILSSLRILQRPIERIPTEALVESLRAHPIRPMADNRHFGKLTQWSKFRVFDPWFRAWRRVIYLDAGMRITTRIDPLLAVPWKGKFVAPDDAGLNDHGCRFDCQLDSTANPKVFEALVNQFGRDILKQRYFLNCIWIYDTQLLDQISIQELEDAMNTYPISLCNEMGIMNLFFTFKLKVWEPLPFRVPNSTIFLFGWANTAVHGSIRDIDYICLKYTINH